MAPAGPSVPVGSAPILRVAAAGVVTALVVAGLSLGAPILVPFAEALLVWFIINALADALRRAPPLGARVPRSAALWLAAGLVALLGLAAVYSGVRSLVAFGPQAIRLQTSLDPLMQQVAVAFGPDGGDMLGRALDAIGLETLMRQVVLGLIGLFNQFGFVAIYVAFLLVDQAFFAAKLRILFPDPARREAVESLLTDLGGRIRAYLWIMTKISALTAMASLVVMLLVGLENPVFWAILVFLLNFIPTIGSILGAFLPAAYALVQFQELGPFLVLLAVLGTIQFVVGNVVLPRLAGSTLNLSLTVTILCLAVWGALWGVTGMFLAVPLTASLLLVAARFEATRPLAVALSQTGALFHARGAVAPISRAAQSDPDGGESP